MWPPSPDRSHPFGVIAAAVSLSLPALGVLALLGLAPALRGRAGEVVRRRALMGAGLALGLVGLLVPPSAAALAEFARAKAAGAVVVGSEPAEDHGSLGYRAIDCEGHRWLFSQRSSDDSLQQEQQ